MNLFVDGDGEAHQISMMSEHVYCLCTCLAFDWLSSLPLLLAFVLPDMDGHCCVPLCTNNPRSRCMALLFEECSCHGIVSHTIPSAMHDSLPAQTSGCASRYLANQPLPQFYIVGTAGIKYGVVCFIQWHSFNWGRP
jgi:hypothetical protein